MAARLLDGQKVAAQIQAEIRPEVARYTARVGQPPGLAIVLVGNDPASEVYVRNKVRTGQESGFRVDLERLSTISSLDDVLRAVERLNSDDRYDGILVQSPLPAALGRTAEQRVFDAIAVAKDVDGFSPTSVGLLVQNRASIAAGTPSGVIELLEREGIALVGRHAVVVGRSDIVGKPMALLLLHRHATVTICHSKSEDLPGLCRQADILVAAVGRPGLITAEFVKPGAIVVDVGINRVTDRGEALRILGPSHPRFRVFEEKGSVLVGDVHPGVAEVAGALTPVPGGVGPLTIAMLMRNTMTAALARHPA
ncbi:MAG: bifunctional 5,10-methylenetetrahydrofolate dehydrogenase/5,10-methenyltetrahydrofolate cyclohydrolase [Vicinamibacterales bacterium]